MGDFTIYIVAEFTEEQVANWLTSTFGVSNDSAQLFVKEKVNGKLLSFVDNYCLATDFQIKSVATRLAILAAIANNN